MKNYGTLENCPFRGPLYIHTKAHREKLLQNNHKHGSSSKDFNKNKDTSKNAGPRQATITCPRLKSNSVRFEDPYDHIHHMNNHHENNHLLDPQEQDIEKIR